MVLPTYLAGGLEELLAQRAPRPITVTNHAEAAGCCLDNALTKHLSGEVWSDLKALAGSQALKLQKPRRWASKDINFLLDIKVVQAPPHVVTTGRASPSARQIGGLEELPPYLAGPQLSRNSAKRTVVDDLRVGIFERVTM